MPTERACRFEQDGNLLVITLLPELAEVPWADVEEIGGSLEGRVRDRDNPQVIVDLTPLAHMGSGMVALVVRIWKAAQEKGGKMVVVNDHELVLEVLQLAGLTNRWTIVTTREEARKQLDARGARRPAAAGPTGSGGGGGLLLAGAGLLAVLASVAGLVLLFLRPDLLPDAANRALLFGGAVLGTVLGTLALAWYVGLPRLAGVAVLVCSVALLVAGLVLTPGLIAVEREAPDVPPGDLPPPGDLTPAGAGADPARVPAPPPADPDAAPAISAEAGVGLSPPSAPAISDPASNDADPDPAALPVPGAVRSPVVGAPVVGAPDNNNARPSEILSSED